MEAVDAHTFRTNSFISNIFVRIVLEHLGLQYLPKQQSSILSFTPSYSIVRRAREADREAPAGADG